MAVAFQGQDGAHSNAAIVSAVQTGSSIGATFCKSTRKGCGLNTKAAEHTKQMQCLTIARSAKVP